MAGCGDTITVTGTADPPAEEQAVKIINPNKLLNRKLGIFFMRGLKYYSTQREAPKIRIAEVLKQKRLTN